LALSKQYIILYKLFVCKITLSVSGPSNPLRVKPVWSFQVI